jgi:soluble lytic murein transglycosylase-like protein
LPVLRYLGTFLLAALIAAPDAPAETPPPADFTFKRVRVGTRAAEPMKRAPAPPAGTRKRITVQIGREPPAAPGAPFLPPGRPQKAWSYAFFWQAVPAARALPAAERLALAERTLAESAAKGVPHYGDDERLRAVAELYGAEIEAAARLHGVSAAFLLAVIAVESAGHVNALSPKGAQGLMQLMPGTARRFGVSDAWSPGQNLAGGAAYLDFLLDLFGGDAVLALAGYNAGENAVIRADGVPDYAETRDYVPKVLSAWLRTRRYCAAPPATVRDPCDLPARTAPPLPFAGIR